MKAYLIYNYFFDENLSQPTIGGIQTYICDLAEVLAAMSYEIIIVQQADNNHSVIWNTFTIQNLNCKSVRLKDYIRTIKKYIDKNTEDCDLVVFMTHTLNCKVKHKKTISIQHGIYWDIPYNHPRAAQFIEFFFRNYHSWDDIKKINSCQQCVAVDYNFLNWYRTQQYFMRSSIHVIPNYCGVIDSNKIRYNQTKEIKILFARRFEKYRGTDIFSDAIERILKEYSNVSVTFAGSGPQEAELKNRFEKYKKVSFTKYKHDESQLVHSRHDIAVVASIGSEGTSLSLLEAMGSHCAVVCTNVGGQTNIVLDGYNGIIADINAESIYKALMKLIENTELRNQIADKAYETAKCAFNKDIWKQKWKMLIDSLEHSDK